MAGWDVKRLTEELEISTEEFQISSEETKTFTEKTEICSEEIQFFSEESHISLRTTYMFVCLDDISLCFPPEV
jgi:hypothetical protein